MGFVKLSRLEDKYVEFFVSDYLVKKMYFNDSEITGWVFVIGKNETKAYHLYQRGYNKEGEVINEFGIFTDMEIKDEYLKKELPKIMSESEEQYNTGENKHFHVILNTLIGKLHI